MGTSGALSALSGHSPEGDDLVSGCGNKKESLFSLKIFIKLNLCMQQKLKNNSHKYSKIAKAAILSLLKDNKEIFGCAKLFALYNP